MNNSMIEEDRQSDLGGYDLLRVEIWRGEKTAGDWLENDLNSEASIRLLKSKLRRTDREKQRKTGFTSAKQRKNRFTIAILRIVKTNVTNKYGQQGR